LPPPPPRLLPARPLAHSLALVHLLCRVWASWPRPGRDGGLTTEIASRAQSWAAERAAGSAREREELFRTGSLNLESGVDPDHWAPPSLPSPRPSPSLPDRARSVVSCFGPRVEIPATSQPSLPMAGTAEPSKVVPTQQSASRCVGGDISPGRGIYGQTKPFVFTTGPCRSHCSVPRFLRLSRRRSDQHPVRHLEGKTRDQDC